MSNETAIRDEIKTLKEVYSKNLKIENGVAVLEPGTFEKTLGEKVSIDTVKSVQNALKDSAAAYTLALGEAALAAMKKDKKLDQVSGDVKAGYDTFGAVIRRTNEARNPANGETVTTHGHTRAYYTAAAGANKGDLAKVRRYLAERGAELLK